MHFVFFKCKSHLKCSCIIWLMFLRSPNILIHTFITCSLQIYFQLFYLLQISYLTILSFLLPLSYHHLVSHYSTIYQDCICTLTCCTYLSILLLVFYFHLFSFSICLFLSIFYYIPPPILLALINTWKLWLSIHLL